jgi:hypothetical protein
LVRTRCFQVHLVSVVEASPSLGSRTEDFGGATTTSTPYPDRPVLRFEIVAMLSPLKGRRQPRRCLGIVSGRAVPFSTRGAPIDQTARIAPTQEVWQSCGAPLMTATALYEEAMRSVSRLLAEGDFSGSRGHGGARSRKPVRKPGTVRRAKSKRGGPFQPLH